MYCIVLNVILLVNKSIKVFLINFDLNNIEVKILVMFNDYKVKFYFFSLQFILINKNKSAIKNFRNLLHF